MDIRHGRSSLSVDAEVVTRQTTQDSRKRGRPSFDDYAGFVSKTLRNRADLLESPLTGLRGVDRRAQDDFSGIPFAEVHAVRRLLDEAVNDAAQVLPDRTVQFLDLYMQGIRGKEIAAKLQLRSRQHVWETCRRPAIKVVTRAFLQRAGVDLRGN